NSQELAQKIEMLSSDIQLRKKIGDYNKEYVKKNFNRTVFSNKWIEVIQKLK
ncbi:MAG: glycosyltransferase family 4 protein, partial [Ignavibacteriales bacterium]